MKPLSNPSNSLPAVFLFALTLLLTTGCGSGSGSNAPTLSAEPSFGTLVLSWTPDTTVDVKYSTDPDCDWDNYSLCDDGELLSGVSGGLTLDGNDLDLNRNYYFVAESGAGRSPVIAAAAWAPGVDGTVRAMVVDEDRLYLGGDFMHAAPAVSRGMLLSPKTGKLQGALQSVNDDIKAVVADGQGGWFIGGDFTEVAGEERAYLARIRSTGALDPDWNSSVNDSVEALLLDNGTLYVGGRFNEANGGTPRTRHHLAAFDAQTGDLLSWNANATNGRVNALAMQDGTLYAGGYFSEADSEEMDSLAAFNAETGNLLETWKNPEFDEDVYALVLHGDMVIVGGEFRRAGAEQDERRNMAALDAQTGELLLWTTNAVNRQVNALAIHDGVLYAGGEFSEASGQPRESLAAFDPNSGLVKWDWNSGTDGDVNTLLVVDDTLYVGGDFDMAGGEARRSLAAFDIATGALSDWAPGADDDVLALAISGGTLYAGGEFDAAGGTARERLAAFDAVTGALLPWNPGADDRVYALAAADNTVYIGGGFEAVNGQERDILAAVDADDGTLLDWAPNPSFTENVRSLLVSGETVVVGGYRFIATSTNTLTRISAFQVPVIGDEQRWWVNVRNSSSIVGVHALALDGEVLYLGGDFDSVSGEDRDYLGAISLDSTDPDASPDVLTGWNPPVDGRVHALMIDNDVVYAGGRVLGGQSWSGLSAFEEDDGNPTVWDPGANGTVNAMILNDGTVYAGGAFSEIDGEGRERLAAIDTTGAVQTDWRPGADGTVWALTSSEGIVYAGGAFNEAGGERRIGLAAFDAEEGELVW